MITIFRPFNENYSLRKKKLPEINKQTKRSSLLEWTLNYSTENIFRITFVLGAEIFYHPQISPNQVHCIWFADDLSRLDPVVKLFIYYIFIYLFILLLFCFVKTSVSV